MRARRPQGASLALIAMAMFFIVLVGVAFFYLGKIFSGFRELQNATDAGGLNIAKNAIKTPAISLATGVEENNFGGLTDSGNINLLCYNRLVAQSMLVALNAQAEGTTQSNDNARTLMNALQSSASSIGKRLSDELTNPDRSVDFFNSIASRNNIKLFNLHGTTLFGNAGYQCSFMKIGKSTNVYLDESILPAGVTIPSDAFSGRTASNGFKYLSGYRNVAFLGGLVNLCGVPLQPGERPHLVNDQDFLNMTSRPPSTDFVPPNAFRSRGQALEATTGMFGRAMASAIIGSLDRQFTACIPRGYLVFRNPAGFSDSSQLPNPNTIFNNELFSGIHVANNGAFSLDSEQILAWVDYNTAEPRPPIAPSSEGIHGDTAGITEYLTPCNYMNVRGESQPCTALLPRFQDAYPSEDTLPGSPSTLSAVEKVKATVMAMFPNGGQIAIPEGFSGVRLFDHNAAYPVGAGQNAQFGQPGTVPRLLAQVGNGADTSILAQIRQRVRQIKPEATVAEIDAVLNSLTVDLGQTIYLYRVADVLTLSHTPPPWIVEGTQPDGSEQSFQVTYQTIDRSVAPQFEAGFRNVIFQSMPDPSLYLLGEDKALYTPSSGFNNLLGVLEFRQRVYNLANPVPPPPPTPPPAPEPTPTPTPSPDPAPVGDPAPEPEPAFDPNWWQQFQGGDGGAGAAGDGN